MGVSAMVPRQDVSETGPRPAVAAADFRAAMSGLAGGVCIVTTDGPAGRSGFTASAVCSVSDEPPMVLVCIKRSASAYPAFQGNRVLCINVLAASQQPLAALFGGKLGMDERFAAGSWQPGADGAPALTGALAVLHGRIAQRCGAGSHEVLICEVSSLATAQAGGDALVYFQRGYHALPGAGPGSP